MSAASGGAAAGEADPGYRPRRFGPFYVAEAQLRTLSKFRWTLIATAIGTPLLYLFSFGVGLATLITGNVAPAGSGAVDYLRFVAPALLVMSATLVATEEFTFGVMLPLKWNPTWVGVGASPITGAQIVSGHFLFVGVRMLITTSIYYVVILCFGAMPDPRGALVIPVGILAGYSWSLLAAYAASVREEHGQFAVVQRLIVLPLTLFSGTVFPLAKLPEFLQPVGWLSPLWHASELARQLAYGPIEPAWLTAVHVVYLVALALVGWRLCQRVVTRRLNS